MKRKITIPSIQDCERLFDIESKCFPAEEAASYEAILHRITNFKDTFWILKENENNIVGFINGCRSNKRRIEDDMFLPTYKNVESGDYILIFSLAVDPFYQGKDYGRVLMKTLITSSRKQGIKEIILTCHDKYISYYESMGYVNQGISQSTHGGSIWYDLILTL